MKRFRHMIRVEWLIAAFCAWHSADLLQAWLHSPYERFGWLAFLIWLIPAARSVFRGVDTSRHFKLAILSLALSFIGTIGDLNFLCYCGLAGIVGAMGGVSGRAWLWLAMSVCWMPAFSLFFARFHFTPPMAQILRLVTAGVAAGAGLCWLAPSPRKTPV